MSQSYKKISLDGLWSNNPGLVQLLGLCPMLAVTGTLVNAIGLGIASTLVLVGSNLSISACRRFIPDSVRLPVFVMIIASFVTSVELLVKAFSYDLYLMLGIFLPLIVTNCVIMGRADAFACKNSVGASILDGLAMGLGFTAVLSVLGFMREALGTGVLFSNMQLLFGASAANWEVVLVSDYPGFLFAIMPPGAFVGMGLLIALKKVIDTRLKERAATASLLKVEPV